MPFRLRCTCNRILTIPDNLAGHKGRCPGCQKKFLIPQMPAYLKPTEKRNPFDPDHPIPPIPVVPLPAPTATPTGPGRYETDEGVQFEEVTELPQEPPAALGGPPEDHDLVATPEPFPVPQEVAASAGAAPAPGAGPPASAPGGAVRPSQRPIPPMQKPPARRPSSASVQAAPPSPAPSPAPPPAPAPQAPWRRPLPAWVLIAGAVVCIGIGAAIMWALGR